MDGCVGITPLSSRQDPGAKVSGLAATTRQKVGGVVLGRGGIARFQKVLQQNACFVIGGLWTTICPSSNSYFFGRGGYVEEPRDRFSQAPNSWENVHPPLFGPFRFLINRGIKRTPLLYWGSLQFPPWFSSFLEPELTRSSWFTKVLVVSLLPPFDPTPCPCSRWLHKVVKRCYPIGIFACLLGWKKVFKHMSDKVDLMVMFISWS